MDDPNDDPTGTKKVRQVADLLADIRLQNADFRRDATYELIEKYFNAYRRAHRGKVDLELVPGVVEMFKGTVSARTVYNALAAMKKKREEEEAHARRNIP